MSAGQTNLTPRVVRQSWIDRVMEAVERWPVPYWLVYLAGLFLEAAIFHIIGWQDGWVQPYKLEPINFLYPLWTWVPMLAMTYLNGVARQSLHDFAHLLDDSPEALARLEAEFTRMPPGPVIVTGLFWVLVYALLMLGSFKTFLAQYGLGPFATYVSAFSGLITFPIGGVLYYHTIRQLRLVSQTVKRVRYFNLFQLDPVYAFSRLTARTGLVWLVMLSLIQLFFPARLLSVVSLSLYIVQALFVFATFVLPLWSVHNRLVEEKRRLLSEVNRRLENKLQRMHRSLDADHLEEMEAIDYTLRSLQIERDFLAKIPTWPWRSGTITGVVSALILPVLLVLIQVILEKWIR